MKNILVLLIAFGVALTTVPALGSGGGGGGGFGGGGGGFGGVSPAPQRITDPVYEHGKAISTGRLRTYEGTKFCVVSEKDETGVAKLRSKALKPYKNTTYQELADALRPCEDAGTPALQVLSRDDIIALIYYLDKRYRLKLG